MIKRVLPAYGLCLLLAVSAGASREESPGKGRLNKDRPTVYISYERTGSRVPLRKEEGDRGIWLRLRNNTRWKLVLRVGGVPNPSYGNAIVFYEVQRIEGSGFTPAGYSSHVASVIQLKAGSSIIFSVPQEHLGEGLMIKVRYNYEWELRGGKTVPAREPYHTVSFAASDLPHSVPN